MLEVYRLVLDVDIVDLCTQLLEYASMREDGDSQLAVGRRCSAVLTLELVCRMSGLAADIGRSTKPVPTSLVSEILVKVAGLHQLSCDLALEQEWAVEGGSDTEGSFYTFEEVLQSVVGDVFFRRALIAESELRVISKILRFAQVPLNRFFGVDARCLCRSISDVIWRIENLAVRREAFLRRLFGVYKGRLESGEIAERSELDISALAAEVDARTASSIYAADALQVRGRSTEENFLAALNLAWSRTGGRDTRIGPPDLIQEAMPPASAPPFIRSGERLFGFRSRFIVEQLLRCADRYVKDHLASSSGGYASWAKARAAGAELLSSNLLTELLRPEYSWNSVFYLFSDQPGRPERWAECDSVMIAGRTLFIVEVKSGQAVESRGLADSEARKSTSERLVSAALNQAARLANALAARGTLSLHHQANGRETAELRLEDLDDIVCVSLAVHRPSIHGLSPRNRRAFGVGDPVWPTIALTLADVVTLNRLLPEGDVAANYLRWRAAVNRRAKLIAAEEIDFMGAYLSGDRAAFADYANDQVRSVHLDGYDEQVLRFFLDDGKRPQRMLPKLLIGALGLRHPCVAARAEFRAAMQFLLDLSDRLLGELEPECRKACDFASKSGQRSLFVCSEPAGLVIVARNKNESVRRDFVRERAHANAVATGAPVGVGLLLEPDAEGKPRVVDAVTCSLETSRNRPSSHRAAEASQMLSQHLIGIRRNDRCPCGSGKKFKRCHGRPGQRMRPGNEQK